MEKGRMVLRMYKGKLANKHSLPGDLSVFRDKERLTNDFAYLGDIVKPNTNLIFTFDSTVAVAKGGFGEGALAVGGVVIAEGGIGMGGVFDGNDLQGGDGFGGNGWGDLAKGGMGIGGIGNDENGVLIKDAGGDGLGGQARKGLALSKIKK
jgi:hypothetical protein